MSGYHQPGPPPEWIAAQVRHEQEQRAAYEAAQRSAPMPLGNPQAGTYAARRAVEDREVQGHITAAVATLTERGAHLLRPRRFRVWWQARRLRADLEWWDEHEPAWPVGTFPWDHRERHLGGGIEQDATGVTRNGELRPMGTFVYGEEPLHRDYPGPLPKVSGLSKQCVWGVTLNLHERRRVAGALEAAIARLA